MSDYAAAQASRLVDPPSILPRRASRFESGVNAPGVPEVDSLVEVTSDTTLGRTDAQARVGTVSRSAGIPPSAQEPVTNSEPPRRGESLSERLSDHEQVVDEVSEPGGDLSAFSNRSKSLPSKPTPPIPVHPAVPTQLATQKAAGEELVLKTNPTLLPPVGRHATDPGPGSPMTLGQELLVADRDPTKPPRHGRERPPQQVISERTNVTRPDSPIPVQTGLRHEVEQDDARHDQPGRPITVQRAKARGRDQPPLRPSDGGPIDASRGARGADDPDGGLAPSSEQTVEVHIGRIEVRAVPPPATIPPAPPRIPAMTLDEYLRRRQRRNT